MKGACLSAFAKAELKKVIKARGLTSFAADNGFNVGTLKKLAKGGYTYRDIIDKVEGVFAPQTEPEEIIALVSEKLQVEKSVITAPTAANHQRYFKDELPAPLKAKWLCGFLIYKEVPRASQRQIAQILGYADHKRIAEIYLSVSNMMDTDPSFRRFVVTLQSQITAK